LPTETDEQVEAALAALLASTTAQAVIVTRAGKGMTLAKRGGGVTHFPGRAREVFDVSGAGDTCLAALGLALGAGATLEQAVQFAILASGVVVGKSGTAVVTPAELSEAEVSQHAALAQSKVTPLDALADQVEAWQRPGRKVGCTHGCCDRPHRGRGGPARGPGHVQGHAAGRPGRSGRSVEASGPEGRLPQRLLRHPSPRPRRLSGPGA